MNPDLRWKQRFQNFEKSFRVLERRIDEYEGQPEMEAFQMALVQSFEIILELSWKLLKDYLENEGLKTTTPKSVIRLAFQSEIISDGAAWMDALKQRNMTSHTYDEEIARQVITFVHKIFYPLACQLYADLKREL